MSRSYRNRKHTGIAFCKDRMNLSRFRRWCKRLFSKRVRKRDIANGNIYKKVKYRWMLREYTTPMPVPKDWKKHFKDSFYDFKYFMCK